MTENLYSYDRSKIFAPSHAGGSIDYDSECKKMFYQYRIIKKLLTNTEIGKKIVRLLSSYNKKNIALYAATDLAQWFVNNVENKENNILRIVAIGDRNYVKLSNKIKTYDIIGLKDIVSLYENNVIDAIVVCSFFYENEILRELLENNIAQDDTFSVIDLISWSSGD